MKPRTRRSRWLAGRARPRPLVVRNVNAGSVTFAPARVRRIWARARRRPGPWGIPDLVLATEMADVDAARQAPDPWQVWQHGPVGSPDSALVIAAGPRVRIAHVGLLPGTPATGEGGGIRARPILRAEVVVDEDAPHQWATAVVLGHAPPARAATARGRYLDAMGDVAGQIKVGDLNVLGRAAVRVTGRRRVHSTWVLHTAVARWIPSRSTRRSRRIDVGSDHPAQDTLLWPPPRKARR